MDDDGSRFDDHRLLAGEMGAMTNDHSWLCGNVDGGRRWSVNDRDTFLCVGSGTI
jgi:hypothetical protein